MLKIPYGVSDFSSIIERGQVFVDRTAYVRRIEEAHDHLLFLRPRRFGKSLWLSIMEHYYDLRFAARFEELFGGLAIGRDPTPLRNSFLVLRLDFSGVDTSADDERLRESWAASLRLRVWTFLNEHAAWLPERPPSMADLAAAEAPETLLRMALAVARTSGRSVYVMIDEYDHFANKLLGTRQEKRYADLARAGGQLRTFFEALKEATTMGPVTRTFTTGVNPLLLDELTSGFNIATNLSLHVDFAGMLGFTAAEVGDLLRQARAEAPASPAAEGLPGPDELADLARAWYDGYRFCPGAGPLYNPDLVLYLLSDVVQGRLPRRLLDRNLRTDLGKLDLVVRAAGDFGRLWQIVESGGSLRGDVVDAFGIASLGEPANFRSLLYYLGMLTYGPDRDPTLRVPNYVVNTLYWDQAVRLLSQELKLEGVEGLRAVLRSMMRDGDAEPFFRLVLDQAIKAASKRELVHFNEASVKAALLAFLSLSDEISVYSEWETGGRYADLVVIPAPTADWLQRAWMIELKYLSKKAATAAARRAAMREGQEQIAGYLQDERRMRYLGRFEMRTAVALFVDGEELVWAAGRAEQLS